MKKYTNTEIDELIDKIPGIEHKYIWYNQFDNTITLDATFNARQLYELGGILDKVVEYDKEINRIKKINLNGITNKNIKVYYYKIYDELVYEFVVVKDNKEYSFYSGFDYEENKDWWPLNKDDEFDRPIYSFIPTSFHESTEEHFTSDNNLEETIKILQDCGFTVDKGDDYP